MTTDHDRLQHQRSLTESLQRGSSNFSTFSNRTLSEEAEEEVVSVRPLAPTAGGAECAEVRVSCPDATGIGCDIARMLLDFGLGVLEGDVSTDGRWCFMIFKVAACAGVAPRWALLKERMTAICPPPSGGLPPGLAPTSPQRRAAAARPFLLQVASYDRRNFLHDLMNTLWVADLSVFKAHITTGPDGRVADLFWVFDNRCELPDTHRVLQICELVRECLQQPRAAVTIEPAQLADCTATSAATFLQHCACKDAEAASPLRQIVRTRRSGASHAGSPGAAPGSLGSSDGSIGAGPGTSPGAAGMDRKAISSWATAHEATDRSVSSRGSWGGGTPASGSEAGPVRTEDFVEVTLDNCTTAAYSLVSVACAPRKGLVYDLLRTLKDVHVRVAYAKLAARPGGAFEADLFLQEAEGRRLDDRELEAELLERLRGAAALPLAIEVRGAFEGALTELRVAAPLDSGGRGRPRVVYDVTAALAALGLHVFMSDVYVEGPAAAGGAGDSRPHELHRFLIHADGGAPLCTAAERQLVYNFVKGHLIGDPRYVKNPGTRGANCSPKAAAEDGLAAAVGSRRAGARKATMRGGGGMRRLFSSAVGAAKERKAPPSPEALIDALSSWHWPD